MKEILVWTIIIVIAWFVFSGGIYDISDWFKEQEIMTLNFNNKNTKFLNSLLPCLTHEMFKTGDRGFADSVMDETCLNICRDSKLNYDNKYKCISGEMYCKCS